MKIPRLNYALCISLFIISFHASGQICDFEFSLGNDTTINCGSSLTLTAPDGYVYNWSTGSITQSITISQAGTYSVEVIETMESIVVNGDFSAGNTGFTSDYIYGTGGTWGILSNEGEYAVAANANNTHTNFANCFNHTTGNASGSMLVANGSPIPDLKIWDQTVAVTPNTDYIFSVWATVVVPTNPGELNFSINGDQIGETFELSPSTCNWENFFITWHSGAYTSAEISIVNQNTNSDGNDFALDDIEFSPICISTDEIVVSLADAPILTLPPMQTICAGDSITLTATSDIEGSTFIWQPGGLQGSEITVSPNSPTQYTAIATSPQQCNSTPKIVVVHVDYGPSFAITITLANYCPGEEFTFVVYPTQHEFDAEYVLTPGNITGMEFTVSSDTTTTYTITATPPDGGCSSQKEWTINVHNPEVEIAGVGEICPGQTIGLTANSTYGGYEYTWEPGSQTGSTIPVSPTETTTYTVHATSPAGCEAEADFTVQVTPAVITITGTTEICPGDTAFLSASANFPDFSFIWTPEPQYGSSAQFIPDTTTTYTIKGTSPKDCNAETEHTVIVTDIPVVEITGVSEICKGEEVVLTAQSSTPNPNLTFLWSTANTENHIKVSPKTTTEYSVVASAGNCPSEPAFKTVIVNPVPIVYPPNDTLVCPGEPVQVGASADIENVTFYWETTDQYGDTIVIDPVNPGYYFVVGETENCTSNRRVFQVGLLETCGCALVMPNVFTPNGDGKNDAFGPAEDDACQYTQFELRVFNRWGKEVWTASDFSKTWDGQIDGKDATEGAYFWTFKYAYTDGSLRIGSEILQGEVMLLKSKL